MDAGRTKTNGGGRQRYDDPELEAEARYARENGSSPPLAAADHRKQLAPDSVRKITEVFVNGTGDKALPPKVLKTGKAERKARSRGVSGCSTKKDGNRFDYGLDCIDLAYNDMVDDVVTSDSEAEYNEYADYVFKYSDEEIRSVIQDYLLNGAVDEALAGLEKFRITADTTFRMLKDLMQLSLEAADGGGLELGTQLIDAIKRDGWLPARSVANAVEEIVDGLSDLRIDSPKIVEATSVFVAKLVDKRILMREMVGFMASARQQQLATVQRGANANEDDGEGVEPKALAVASQCFADALTYADNRTLLKGKCVPAGGHQSVEVLSTQFKMILREFLVSNDRDVACARVNELKVPHFNHDLVYQACVLALEKMDTGVMKRIGELLKCMHENGIITTECLTTGYEKMYCGLSDLYLDLPAAYTLARRWVDVSLAAGFLEQGVADNCPTRARSRTVSEGPDGKLICDAELPPAAANGMATMADSENDENRHQSPSSKTKTANGEVCHGPKLANGQC